MDLTILDNSGPWLVLLLLLLPLGEDLIIIPAGFMIGQNPDDFPVFFTFVCAYVGSFISDGIWYFISYRFGTPLLHKKWFKRLAHPRLLLQAKHQVEKRGAWLIVTARFVPGTRTSTMIASGLLHMPVWKFMLAEGGCLLITVPMQLTFGYLISKHLIGDTGTTGKIMTIIALVVVLIVGAFIYNRWREHRKTKKRAPRSKAIWLRRFRKPREKGTAEAR